MNTTIGPKMKELIVARMALVAIPAGSGNKSFDLGLDALITPGKTARIFREASDWAKTTIAALRAHTECPFDNDEDVAADILKTLKERGLI